MLCQGLFKRLIVVSEYKLLAVVIKKTVSVVLACVTVASPRKKKIGESLSDFFFFFRGEPAVTQAIVVSTFEFFFLFCFSHIYQENFFNFII